MREVHMPQTTEDAQDSVVVFWYKSEGDHVEAGETLVEVQTEKATYDVEAPASGILREIQVPRGQAAPVGAVLAYIEETVAETPPGPEPQPGVDPVAMEPRDTTAGTATVTGDTGSSDASAILGAPRGRRSFVPAPPRVRKLAADLGVDLAGVHGTGPNGRITEDDVRAAAQVASGQAIASNVRQSQQRSFIQPLPPVRRTIARRMLESLRETAQLTLTRWVDVTALAEQRQHLAPGISWNTWVLRGVALALRHHPELNATWEEAGIHYHTEIHLGVAVDAEAGLVVTVIRDVDTLSLSTLHEVVGRRVEAARSGRLAATDLTGSTFTVSNLGGFGVSFFTPILNPPESAILGVGQVEETLTLANGLVQARKRLPLSLTIDHRVLDGADGARFLQTLARLLQEPAGLV
ncbi:MAG: 2-oxo acid dehydrogenase subunit E2 [Alicyclobacillus herbarius]|uniref:dihydrolipoamide acetyltransferase family protein n=1 Tax=Alicyclobacillus herbarius TaxID=122960 RepID=UPI002354E3DE|nr:dihydrolipoamide acetyltransferase family protein [Alicyclobacillus herbarius]MCL6633729.1 2-oxo acid dehydrogenase subunit E2 [Alicyclobacillus herbarius]